MGSTPLVKKKKPGNKTLKSNNNKNNKPNMNKPKKVKTKTKRSSFKPRGVIYIGHIPHGFYEDEMKSYFNQFGPVVATTVARSKRTGRSKGYGFVEFKDEEVAKIAAETMNNYLMFNRLIKCRYIPPEERKSRIFVRTIRPTDCPRQKNRLNNEKNKLKAVSSLTKKNYLKKTQKKITEFKKFFEERGIEFQFQLNDNSFETSEENEINIKSESESETEDDTDDQFGVLEIDESDNEIHFKTPPKVKKVIKRSVSFPVTSSKEHVISQTQTVKNSPSNKIKKNEKTSLKRKLNSHSVIEKVKRKKKNTKKIKKPLKAKNLKSLNPDIPPLAKKKTLKLKKNISNKMARKEITTKQRSQIANSKLNKTKKAT